MSRYETILEVANRSYKNRIALVEGDDDAKMERDLKKAKKALSQSLSIIYRASKGSHTEKEDRLRDILEPMRLANTRLQNMLNKQF